MENCTGKSWNEYPPGTVSIFLKQSLCYSAVAATSVGNANLYMSLKQSYKGKVHCLGCFNKLKTLNVEILQFFFECADLQVCFYGKRQ